MNQDFQPEHPPHRRFPNVRSSFVRVVLATALAVATMVGFMPAPSEAATTAPYIWVDRVDSKFVVQGLKWPANAQGTVSAGIGGLSGSKSFRVQSNGYFWVEFYAFTPDKCGDAWGNVNVNGVKASATKKFTCSGSQTTPTSTSAPKPAASAPASAAPAPSTPAPSTPSGWRLVNSDEFNGSSLDESKWGIYVGSGNAGVGRRERSAVSVSNGALKITGKGDVAGGIALNKNYTYGRFEVRARTDKGAGYGPAALLWPSSERWPVDGEVDISEIPKGDRKFSGSYVHWASNNQVVGHEEYADHSQWHTYAVDWEPGKLTFYLDGRTVWTVTQGGAVPTSSHFLALQLDVGNGGFIEKRNSSTPSEVSYYVDYARVYQR